MNKDWNNLLVAAQQVGIELDSSQVEQFQKYLVLLQNWNKVMNLTAIEDEEGIIYKHFLDSLLYAKHASVDKVQNLVDVGTGAGFPGIPLKIWQKDLEVVLIDSLQKRLNFLQEVITSLGLKNISLVHGRAEDLGKDEKYREKFQLVVSRAVAALPVLAEYCMPFVKVGGYFVAAKGPEINKELSSAEPAITLLGGEAEEIISYTLPFANEQRSVIRIKKIAQTPVKYPRKAGLPSKKPLS